MKKQELQNLYDYLSAGCKKSFLEELLTKTGRGGQYASRDYIHANAVLSELKKVQDDLSSFQTVKSAVQILHPATKFRLSFYSPCLAFRYDELKPQEQVEIFENPKYVFTTKENGMRGTYVYINGQSFLYSRNYSEKDCSLPEYWGNVYQNVKFEKPNEVYAIDCEVKFEPGANLQRDLLEYGIETTSKLEAICALMQMSAEESLKIQKQFRMENGRDLVVFRCIHVLYYKGKNFMRTTLGEGMNAYKEAVSYGRMHGLNVREIEMCDGNRQEKEIFLNSILEQNGEGIVAHYTDGFYCTSDNRNKNSFIKLKRSVSGFLGKSGVADSFDGWISGYKLGTEGTENENQVSTLEVSIKLLLSDGRKVNHVIAYVPNLTKELRNKLTVIGLDGKPVMAQQFYDRVVEVDGQNISKVSRRLTHPKLLRFRIDKLKEDCMFSEEFIESQID